MLQTVNYEKISKSLLLFTSDTNLTEITYVFFFSRYEHEFELFQNKM